MTPGNMRRVADELAHMRGAAMKLGQLISMDAGDVMPKKLADVFARLRADAHFMPPAQPPRHQGEQGGCSRLIILRVSSNPVRPKDLISTGFLMDKK
jgi:hypothetical protein